MGNITRYRRRSLFCLAIIAIVFTAVWFICRSAVHPEFGLVHVTGMAMRSPHPPSTFWERAETTVRSWLRLQQRYGPKSDYGLQVGPAVLGWSFANNGPAKRDGYIYMCDVRPSGGNGPLWEFALSAKQRLRDVTQADIHTEFYRMNDPRGTNVFGSAWRRRTMLVPEGQIFFARLETNPSAVYIIRLAKQQGVQTKNWATMKIEYVVATNNPPNKITGAGGPRQSPIRTRWAARVAQF